MRLPHDYWQHKIKMFSIQKNMKLCSIQIMESKIGKFLNLQLYFNVVEMKHAECNNEETDDT